MTLAHHYRTLGLRRGASFQDVKVAYRRLVREYHPDINPDEQAIERFISINDAYTVLSEFMQAKVQAKAQARKPAQTKVERKQASAFSGSSGPLNLEKLSVESLKLQLDKLGIGSFSHQQMPFPAGCDAACENATENATENTTENTTENVMAGNPTEKSPPMPPNAKASQAFKVSQEFKATSKEHILKQDAYLQLKDLLRQQKFPRAIALVEGLAHRMPNDLEIKQWQAIVYQRWGRQLIGQGEPQKARIYLKKALRTDPHNPSLWSEVSRDFGKIAHLDNSSSSVM